MPSFRQTLSSCQQWGPLPGAVSQEESQGREIPFHRGVVDGQCSRVGGCRGVAAAKAEEPLDHLMVTEAGCQVEDGGTRVVCVLQEEVGRLSVPGTKPFRPGAWGPQAAVGYPPARSRFRTGGVARVEFLSVGSGAGAGAQGIGGTVGPACLPSVKGLRLHTVSAAQCSPCSTGRGAPNCGNLPPSPAVPPARPPSTLGGAWVGLATGQEVADAC